MAKEKHVEGEADHYIKTLIGAVLGYAADGLDMFLLSFILVFIIKDFGLTKCERKAPKFIYGDISSLKNNDSISLFFIVLYF